MQVYLQFYTSFFEKKSLFIPPFSKKSLCCGKIIEILQAETSSIYS